MAITDDIERLYATEEWLVEGHLLGTTIHPQLDKFFELRVVDLH